MSKTALAFYYDWYASPEVSGQWGHWNECHYATRDPGQVDERGYRDLGAAHNPALGPYDSVDPKIVEAHIGMAEDIGLDVFAATWWGQKDTRFEPILERAASSSVKVALYWETITDPTAAGAVDDILWALKRAEAPGYFKFEGRPVVFVYRRNFTQVRWWSDWHEVIETVRKEHDPLFIADTSAVEAMSLFDGYHITTSVLQVLMGEDMGRFHRAMRTACRDLGKIYAAPVIPGFDNARVHEKGRLVTDRLDGQLYEDQWAAALTRDPEWVMVNSFNEWHEGSEIEPSLEDGDRYLKETKKWIERFKGA